jgi:cell division protein FtsB
MKVEVGIWGRLTQVVIFLFVVALVLAIGRWYLPLIRQNERMRKEIMRLEAEKQKQEETSRELRTSIDSLKRDPKAVERLARERLGYAKPGEVVVHFEPSVTNQMVR